MSAEPISFSFSDFSTLAYHKQVDKFSEKYRLYRQDIMSQMSEEEKEALKKTAPTDIFWEMIANEGLSLDPKIVFLGSDKMDVQGKGFFPNNILLPMIMAFMQMYGRCPMHLAQRLRGAKYDRNENMQMIQEGIDGKKSFFMFHPYIVQGGSTYDEFEPFVKPEGAFFLKDRDTLIKMASEYKIYEYPSLNCVSSLDEVTLIELNPKKKFMPPMAFVYGNVPVLEEFSEMAQFYIDWCSGFTL